MKTLDLSEILKEITKHTKIRREFGCFVELNQKKTFDRMELLLNLRSHVNTQVLSLSYKSCKKNLKNFFVVRHTICSICMANIVSI